MIPPNVPFMNIAYWSTTLLTALYLAWSAYAYLFSDTMIEGVRAIGFPDFFRIELAVLKAIAVVVLVVPGIPGPYKEWAYVGVGLFYLTSLVAHFAHKDPLVINLINVGLIAVLVASFWCGREAKFL